MEWRRLKMISIILFISSLLIFFIFTCVIILTISFVFIGDLSITLNVLRDSLKLSFSKKEQEKNIKIETYILNVLFKHTAEEIVGMPDKKLKDLININKQDAQKFKTKINSILKNPNIKFVTVDDVKLILKKTNNYSFINILISKVEYNSNKRYQLLSKSIDKYNKKELNQRNLHSIFTNISNMSEEQVQTELNKLKKKNKKSNDIIQPDIIKNFFSLNNTSKINLLYKYIA